MPAITLPQMAWVGGDLMDESAGRSFGALSTPIGSEPENATMQLLHQT
jgi:hypothetical protein